MQNKLSKKKHINTKTSNVCFSVSLSLQVNCFVFLFLKKKHTKKLNIITVYIYHPLTNSFHIPEISPDFSGQSYFADKFSRYFKKFLRSFADGKFCNILHTFYLIKSSITAKINTLKVLKLEFDMKKMQN